MIYCVLIENYVDQFHACIHCSSYNNVEDSCTASEIEDVYDPDSPEHERDIKC
jgi:hypothetical protein